VTTRRIANVLRKEWLLMARSPSNLLFVAVIPLLLVGQALFLSWILPRFLAVGVPASSTLAEGLSDVERFRVLLLDQFRFFVLLIPAMVANVFATLSIVEEKVTRTLEPLLATPVRTWELLVGKILAGAVPALTVAWVSTGIFVLLAIALGWGSLLRWVIGPAWYLSVFLLNPAISILSFVLGVIGSSRAGDAKGAQNLAVVVVLPLFALIALQVTGMVRFTPLLTLTLSIGIAVLDAVMLRLAVRLFALESILIRWR
jgi:ABC-2 type transport system permease protein